MLTRKDRGGRSYNDVLTTSLLVSVLLMSAPAASDRYGAFAFPNPAGTELLVHHNLPHPERLHTALCDGARKIAVRFVRRQTTRQPDGTREWPDDFSQLEGTVFQVLNQRLGPKSTCFIAEDALLTGAELLRVEASAKPPNCTPDDQRRAATVRTRAIKSCWKLAVVPTQGFVAAVEYERAGRDALASVMMVSNDSGRASSRGGAGGRGRIMSMDFPAEFTAEGDDLWRVEDEGHLYPERFLVPFLLRKGNALVVPLAWGGAEGVNLHLYVAESTAPAGQVISDYWYRAPR
jgi:hypothetical protein